MEQKRLLLLLLSSCTVNGKVSDNMEYKLLKRFHEVVPARYLLCFLAFLGFFNLFTLRTNIAVSLVAMTGVPIDDNATTTTSNDCPNPESGISHISNSTPATGQYFAWNQKDQGLLLSSYFIGFTVTQLLGGVLSNYFQAKWVVGLGVLGSAVLSLAAPSAAYAGFWVFFAIRMLTGLSSGVSLSAMYSLLAFWSPLRERGLILSIVYTGTSLGAIVAQFSSGYIIATMNQNGEGWKFPFYIFGCIAVLWFIAWTLLVYNSPQHHIAISEKELRLLKQDYETEDVIKIPWLSIISSIPFWALVCVNMSHNWGLDLFQMQLPNFFKNVLHVSIEKTGLYSSLPFILKTIVGSVCGTISTWIEIKFQPSVNFLRKVFTMISYVCAGGILLGVGYTCNEALNIILLTLAMGLFGFYSVGPNCSAVDMSPRFSGIIIGISNTISNFAGFICPVITADIVSKKQSLQNWRYVFLIASCLYIGSAILFLIFGSSSLQPWAEGKRNEAHKRSRQQSTDVNVNSLG